MKKIIPDPLDYKYNYEKIVNLFTYLSEDNVNYIEYAERDINTYIEYIKNQDELGELKAVALSIRFETDSDFKRQMIEANMQHNAIIASLNDERFYNDFLWPRIEELINSDYQDTKDYRMYLLTNFSFEKMIEEGFYLNDVLIQRGVQRIKNAVNFLKGE